MPPPDETFIFDLLVTQTKQLTSYQNVLKYGEIHKCLPLTSRKQHKGGGITKSALFYAKLFTAHYGDMKHALA